MLLGNQPQTNSNNPSEQYDEWIVQLLSGKQYVEAYRLLKSEPPQKLSTLFNLALCLYFAEEYEQSLYQLDAALAKLQPNITSNFSINDDLYKKLESKQNVDNSYMQGITDKYVRHFPYMVKSNILRMKIDCYRALCQWNKIMELAAPLRNENYRNVEEAVAEAIARM